MCSSDLKKKPIEEKESYCWIKGYEAANQIAVEAPNTLIVSVADREGDIYELLDKLPSDTNKAFWLVRCQHNRLLLTEDKKPDRRLWEEVKASEPIGKIEFYLPEGKIYNREKAKRNARKKRLIEQEIRVKTVQLKPAERRNGEKLNAISIQVIHCKEINPPDEEDKIEWYLLTSVPVHCAERAVQIVQ